jgi:hypothetical protein
MEMFLWFVHLMRLSLVLLDLHLLRLTAVSFIARASAIHSSLNDIPRNHHKQP